MSNRNTQPRLGDGKRFRRGKATLIADLRAWVDDWRPAWKWCARFLNRANDRLSERSRERVYSPRGKDDATSFFIRSAVVRDTDEPPPGRR